MENPTYIEVTERMAVCLKRIYEFDYLWSCLTSESEFSDEGNKSLSNVMDMLFSDLREAILSDEARGVARGLQV